MDTVQLIIIATAILNLGLLVYVLIKLSKVEETKAEKLDTDELLTHINKFQSAMEKHFGETGKMLFALKESSGKSGNSGFVREIIEYFEIYYAHYRICQSFAGSEALKQSDRFIAARETFYKKQDVVMAEWNKRGGKIRLILPDNLLSLHKSSIDLFNEFSDTAGSHNPEDETSYNAIIEVFSRVHEIKNRLEQLIRRYLRDEGLLK
ncbi:MAG: hypothetical protein K8S56_10310 [Candidatus Cloacimonetes bacterium]|nr:hypothetical protein [Candidatus Cloacimonadota bacterium]